MSIDWAAIPRRRDHRQFGDRPRWFNGAPAQSIAVDPRGRFVLTGGSRFVRLFWAASGELVRTFEGPGTNGTVAEHIGFTPDGQEAIAHVGAALGKEGAVTVWDVETGGVVRRFDTQNGGGISAIDRARGRTIGRGPAERALLVDVRSGETRLLQPRPDGGLGASVFVSGDRVIGAASAGGLTRCWNAATGVVVWERDLGTAFTMCAPDDGRWFACAGAAEDGVRVCDPATGETRFVLTVGDPGSEAILSLDATPDGRRVLAVRAHAAAVWDVEARTVVAQPALSSLGGRRVGALDPDGRWFVHVGLDGHLWKISLDSTMAERAEADLTRGHGAAVMRVEIGPGGSVVSSDRSGVTLVWDAGGVPVRSESREVVRAEPPWASGLRARIEQHLNQTEAGSIESFEAGEELALVIASAGDVEVWNRAGIGAGLEIGWSGSGLGSDHATAIAIHPDGKRGAIGTSREDAPIEIWDLVARVPLAILEGHEAAPRALAFSPDGKTLVSGGDDCSVRVWSIE